MAYTPAETRYDTMKYRRCGRSGLLLPAISLGLWHNFGHDTPHKVKQAICRTAFDLGITHFQQLAEISEVDIDRVAQQLKGFRSRIYREDWIGQARDLHAQKNGGLS